MPIPALVNGGLPLGRWPATVAEIEQAFVVGKSAARQAVWNDWMATTAALRECVAHVPAAWIGGSFLTDKDEPQDIDCVYLLEWSDIVVAKMDASAMRFLVALADCRMKDLFDLSVDTFILEWAPTPGVNRPDWTREYLGDRGYWDDLWSRQRSSDNRLDAIPRRGYLEVEFDGYQ